MKLENRTMKPSRIAIIGCAGSGKTTLALRLAEKYHLPVYHLDLYYWKPGWEPSEWEEFQGRHDALCKEPTWIIEGAYGKAFSTRAHEADTIIFLDIPRRICLWRVIKRTLKHHGQVIPGNPSGCAQRVLSLKFWEFLKWIWTYNHRSRPSILALIDHHAPHKRVLRLTSLDEIEHHFS